MKHTKMSHFIFLAVGLVAGWGLGRGYEAIRSWTKKPDRFRWPDDANAID